MRFKVFIVSGFTALLYLACTKDKGKIYVPDYRIPFVGIYTGTYLKTSKRCGSTNNCSPLDTSYYSQNHSFTVGISSAGDSLLTVNFGNSSTDYTVNANGNYNLNFQVGSGGYSRSMKFSNNSLIYSVADRYGHVAFGATYSYEDFSGVKQ